MGPTGDVSEGATPFGVVSNHCQPDGIALAVSLHHRFVMALLLPALALAVSAWAGPQAHGYFASAATTYPTLALDPALTREVRATVYHNAAAYDWSGDDAVKSAAKGITTGDIHLAGVLRVGYNASVMPFCYVNDAGDLVGFDVA